MFDLNPQFWERCRARVKSDETIDVLRQLLEYATKSLKGRLNDVRFEEGKSVSLFSKGREILTFNVTRDGLRIYIHPPAGARFDPASRFDVERFQFWESSLIKASGMYRAASVWISRLRFVPVVKGIIDMIPDREGSINRPLRGMQDP